MAFSIPWLETVSKRERQRREEKAQRLMFPFGDEQRTAELAVLRALIQTKARDADLLYQLFQAKDCLRPMQDEMPEEQQERLAAWLTSQLARGFKPAERAVFVALAELERPMQSMADMPDADAVARQAEEFCKAANATGVVLTKLDGTPRGGCAVSVWENLGLPIRFIGVGEKIDDLMEFDAQTFVESLLPESALQKDEKKEEGESEA